MPQLPGGQAGRNLLRMRQADRAGVSPNRSSRGMTLIHPIANRLSYDSLRKNELTFNIATAAFEDASFFEALSDPAYKKRILEEVDAGARAAAEASLNAFMSPSAAVDSLALAVRTDDTALKFVVKKKTVGPGNIANSYPHLIAALREAAGKSELEPRRAGDALVTLSILAMHDSTLGDGMAIINRVLEQTGNTLRRHLSDEASAVFHRGNLYALKGDVKRSLRDFVEAIGLAEAKYAEQVRLFGSRPDGDGCVMVSGYDFTGLAWSFKPSMAICLHSLGRNREAYDAFKEYVDATDDALRNYPLEVGDDGVGVSISKQVDGSVCVAVSPVTGGRERDPHKLARVVDSEYSAAMILLSSYTALINGNAAQNDLQGSPSDLCARGRALYQSAVAREASLPKEAALTMFAQKKIACQVILVTLPATRKNQAAINMESKMAGSRQPNVLECHTCGRIDHDGLKMCGGCKKTLAAAYCSKACQENAWPLHKAACKAARRG